MKDEKCGTKPAGCDTKDENKGGSCSTTKPHEEKKRGYGCGGGTKK